MEIIRNIQKYLCASVQHSVILYKKNGIQGLVKRIHLYDGILRNMNKQDFEGYYKKKSSLLTEERG